METVPRTELEGAGDCCGRKFQRKEAVLVVFLFCFGFGGGGGMLRKGFFFLQNAR